MLIVGEGKFLKWEIPLIISEDRQVFEEIVFEVSV